MARQPDDDHDRRRRRDTGDPTATVAGQQRANDDDSGGDHRRDQEHEHAPDPSHQLDEHVRDGIHGPKGIERERPSIERDIAGAHSVSLQHDSGSVRVSGERVAR